MGHFSVEQLFSTGEGPRARTKVAASDQPLAARMRPDSLGEFVGQEHLLGRGSALRPPSRRAGRTR